MSTPTHPGRPASSRGQLIKLGFQDTDRAAQGLAALGEYAAELAPLLGVAADPDLALHGLLRLMEAGAVTLPQELVSDEGLAMRLLSVLGASEALADHLVRHPEQWVELADPTLGSTRTPRFAMRASLLRSVGADPAQDAPVASKAYQEACECLRVEYRRLLMRLASRDLSQHLGLDDAAAEISDLACATLEAALAVARAKVGAAAAEQVRFSVIAMGKCGGHELNYISDVDVIFVHEPVAGHDEGTAARTATQLAATLIQVCGDHTREGTIWPVDAALRPEGKAGPLSRRLASHQSYYERWAKTWEFQALLKARAAAGDLALAQEYLEMIRPMVWKAAERDGFVGDVQAMRLRVLDHIPSHQADRQLKLGSGGLRDVEFAVQLLQLVHGRADHTLREPTTLSALAALTRGGYVGRPDGEKLAAAYSFLRRLEHRIQLFQLRRTHIVPSDADSLRRLGRSLGHIKDPAGELDKEWQHHRREVKRLHEKLFYRPLLNAVARIPGEDSRLTTSQAEDRLAALGFADPAAALRHLGVLTDGVSRAAAIQRTLLPAMLQWFAEAPDPDAGLFGFRRISESLGSTPWYLGLLRDEGTVAQRLATLLATSRYATDLLEREPQGVQLLGGNLLPLSSQTLLAEMLSNAGRNSSADDAVRAVRGVRRRELFRIAAGELFGQIDVDEVGLALTRLTDATLEAALAIAERSVLAQRGWESAPTAMAVIAMGRYGGFELSYASDADVMFVHDPVDGADLADASSYAQAVANELRRSLAVAGPDPALEVDADLRPEGRSGPLVRTLDSYAKYYGRWSAVWEFQALLRADAVVGDQGLRERFTTLIDPLRFPTEGLSEADIVEVRRIKARVDNERLPRGADPKTHFKLGRGGLADIEWTVQLLQMQHAGAVTGMQTPRTLPALRAAVDADLLAAADGEILAQAWRVVSRMRNAALLVRGKPTEQLPRDPRERAAMAVVLGYRPGETDLMVNDYLRITRQAHTVVEKVFWE